MKFGAYLELLGPGRWRKPALLGMLLSVTGVVGLWGIGFFAPELVGDVVNTYLTQQNVSKEDIASQAAFYRGLNGIVQNLGAFCGMLGFSYLAQWTGRRQAFVVALLAH